MIDLTKYNTAAKICHTTLEALMDKIHTKQCLVVRDLCELGNNLIKSECAKIYKKETNKGIAFPVSISLNNCVGNYVHDDSLPEYNTIQPGDVVKLELGVVVGGCIAVLGETIVNGEHGDYLKMLEILKKKIVNLMSSGNTNDDVTMSVESICTEYDCFPKENSTSYQQLDGHLQTQDSKYILFNHQKYYDDEDMLIGEENLCFEFEEGEVYNINLTVVPEDPSGPHSYKELCEPHIARFNDCFYSLKLKSAREYVSMVKKNENNNAFYLSQYNSSNRAKLGIKECFASGILEPYHVLCTKTKIPVYHAKFTVVVGKDKGVLLKYS